MSIIKHTAADSHNSAYFGNHTTQITKGRNTCERFVECATSAGYECRQSTTNEDKYAHIDYHLYFNGEKYCSIDLKSKSKHGWTAEHKNNFGYPGSMYGKMDYICYVDEDYAYFVNPLALRNYFAVHQWQGNVDSNDIWKHTDDSRWKYNHTFTRISHGWRDEWFIISDADFEALVTSKLPLKDSSCI